MSDSDSWTEEQVLIALEFYFTCPERMHTDSHPKCKEIAALIGRTPGALDRIIRNIKYVDSGGTGLEHASSLVHKLVGKYKSNVPELKERVGAIRTKNGWSKLDCGS